MVVRYLICSLKSYPMVSCSLRSCLIVVEYLIYYLTSYSMVVRYLICSLTSCPMIVRYLIFSLTSCLMVVRCLICFLTSYPMVVTCKIPDLFFNKLSYGCKVLVPVLLVQVPLEDAGRQLLQQFNSLLLYEEYLQYFS